MIVGLKRWWPLLPLAVALVWHSLRFDFVCDDAYISFVYSRNLAEHGQLVFNLGDRVEGYTNFLWTVLLAGFLKLGVAPELSSRVLGTAFAIATLGVVARLSARARDAGRVGAWDFLPAALLAASSSFACWASGGLETQMYTFLVTLGFLLYLEDRLPLAGVAFALGALTRPEGNLVFALVLAHRAAVSLVAERRLRPRRSELWLAGVYLAIYVPYFAWRWWYYGWPFPNTFYVKTGGAPSPEYARQLREAGLYYVWQWARQSQALVAAPLVALALWKRPRFASLAALVAGVYLVYTARVGGDFMGLHRFVMPLFPLLALCVGLGLHAAVGLAPARARLAVGLGAAAVVLGGFGYTQAVLTRVSQVAKADHGIDRPGYLRLYAHDRGLLGKALAPHMRPDDFSFVGGVGVQPYYARMRAVDVFGLVSEEIAHEVPPTRPRPGHQKWAPPQMVLAHRPTFIFYCYQLHAAPNAYSLCGEAGFFRQHGYEPVTIHVPGLKEAGEYYTFLKRKDRPWP